MNLLKEVETMSKNLKCYNGLTDFKYKDNGFDVAITLSKELLGKTVKGHRERKVVVVIDKKGFETLYDYANVKDTNVNIVGLSSIIKNSSKFLEENSLHCVKIELELLEVRGLKDMWIQVGRFSWY